MKSSYLSTVDILHSGLPEEKIDEVALAHGVDEIGRCKKQPKFNRWSKQ